MSLNRANAVEALEKSVHVRVLEVTAAINDNSVKSRTDLRSIAQDLRLIAVSVDEVRERLENLEGRSAVDGHILCTRLIPPIVPKLHHDFAENRCDVTSVQCCALPDVEARWRAWLSPQVGGFWSNHANITELTSSICHRRFGRSLTGRERHPTFADKQINRLYLNAR